MKKEKLTIQNIKTDLKKRGKINISGIVILTVFFLISLYLTIALFGLSWTNLFPYFSAFITLSLLVAVVCVVFETINLYRIINNAQCIVKDKLIGKEIKEYITRYGMREEYYLYFGSYGKFLIAGEYYSWSNMFSMAHESLYRSSDCGDEFYLVLTKRHTGKVLMAYNTKMFEME